MKNASKIREAREKAGLSIKELAELLGAPYRTVQDWNAGRSRPVEWAERLILEKLANMSVSGSDTK